MAYTNVSGPLYPGAITDASGSLWTTPNNAKVEDGATAQELNVGPGGGGVGPAQLLSSLHGFNLPATAVIDGIKLEAKVSSGFSSDYQITVGKTGKQSTANPASFGQLWPVTLTWLTWGGPTELWGRSDWTPADINDTTFGGGLAAFPTHSTDSISVDAIRVTVYWHTAPTDVPKRYDYKIFNSAGTFLGSLSNVISEFAFSHDINTAGCQLSIEVASSLDTINQIASTLTDESGNTLTDENGNIISGDSVQPMMLPGSSSTDALIKNGNTIQVWETGYYNPNGKCMFLGVIERWEADFGAGGDGDTIRITAYSDGQDLDNYMVRAFPYTYTGDVTQAVQNASDTLHTGTGGLGDNGWNRDGQSWKPGTGVTNLAALSLLLNGTANVTIGVYSDAAYTTLIGTVSQAVNVSTPTEIQFAFPASIPVTAGTTYYFGVNVDAGQSILIYYDTGSLYANGGMTNNFYGGGSGGGTWGAASASNDLYFKTFSGVGSTAATFSTMDPTTMVKNAINDYIARGGLISYTGSSIATTGLSLTYPVNTNTIMELIKAALSMSPNGFYYYVDLGTDILYMKQASATPDITIIKGRHIQEMTLVASIETVKNDVFFTGGATSGTTLYKRYGDPASQLKYGVRLDRRTDNRVTVTGTADAIGGSAVATQKDETYQTKAVILDKTMDITTLKPGMVVGFAGFGTFVDGLMAQIVRIDYTPEAATLSLGVIPKRLMEEFEKVTRGLIAQQTIANPSAPS